MIDKINEDVSEKYFFIRKRGTFKQSPSHIKELCLITQDYAAADISLLAAMSTSTRSFPLSRPSAFLFLSIWAIIILAISCGTGDEYTAVKFLLNTCKEYNT